MRDRIAQCFARLAQQGRAAFIPYLMAGDPDTETTLRRMHALVDQGADILELGFPFTDPSADGPVIEEAGLRALKSKTTLSAILYLVAEFRKTNAGTPLILMGYTNPVYHMGYQRFAQRAASAGVDGLLIVDCPPEEDRALRAELDNVELSLIRLATPTTDAGRLVKVLNGASGFLYYVAQKGVTGGEGRNGADIGEALAAIRSVAELPVVVGFGIQNAEQARAMAPHARGVVVGSALVEVFHRQGEDAGIALAGELAKAIHSVRQGENA